MPFGFNHIMYDRWCSERDSTKAASNLRCEYVGRRLSEICSDATSQSRPSTDEEEDEPHDLNRVCPSHVYSLSLMSPSQCVSVGFLLPSTLLSSPPCPNGRQPGSSQAQADYGRDHHHHPPSSDIYNQHTERKRVRKFEPVLQDGGIEYEE